MMRRRNPSIPPSESGQSLVEMSLTMVVLLIILAGALDLGRMYFTYLALKDAAGEGASYASIHPTWINSSAHADPNNIVYRTKNESPSGLINWSNATVIVSAAPTPLVGQHITVTVQYSYTLITPVMGAIAGGPILPLSATTAGQIQISP